MKADVKKWSEIRDYLSVLKQSDLIALIGDLCKLNDENKYFIGARCSETCAEAIKPYKSLVKQFISPDIPFSDERIQKAKAKKTINDYWRASGDPYGKIDLMLYYVECGTQFTLEYGDINESFYNSLVAMFKQSIIEIKKISSSRPTKSFILRLNNVVDISKNIGWGYGDEVKTLFIEENFSIENNKNI